jgi:hypothetical protein
VDKYTVAFIKTKIHIDSGNRVWCGDKQLEVHLIGGVRKIVLPFSKITYTFDQLLRAGAKCEGQNVLTLARAGAEARWGEQIENRRKIGLPSNVYVANARSIEYAIEKGKSPPPARYVGRMRDKITEVRDTVDEVVDDMAEGRWRTQFAKGRYARKSRV